MVAEPKADRWCDHFDAPRAPSMSRPAPCIRSNENFTYRPSLRPRWELHPCGGRTHRSARPDALHDSARLGVIGLPGMGFTNHRGALEDMKGVMTPGVSPVEPFGQRNITPVSCPCGPVALLAHELRPSRRRRGCESAPVRAASVAKAVLSSSASKDSEWRRQADLASRHGISPSIAQENAGNLFFEPLPDRLAGTPCATDNFNCVTTLFA